MIFLKSKDKQYGTVFSISLTGKEEVKVLKKKEANTMFTHLP
jgi:hypothetical protein